MFSRGVFKDCNPQHLLQLSMTDEPLMLQVNLSIVWTDINNSKSNKFVTSVKIRGTNDSKL